MKAIDFIKKNYPVTAIEFQQGKCVSLEDVALIMEKYAKEINKEILIYVENQIEYCKEKSSKPEYKTDKYSKGNCYTDEQMSGFYQGKGEANYAILYLIRDIFNNKNNTG